MEEARARGYTPLEALQEARERLKVLLPPSHYKVVKDGEGWVRLVAVLKRGENEVDRVSLRSVFPSPANSAEIENLEKVARLHNCLPLEARPLVAFYPWGRVDVGRILEVLGSYLELVPRDTLAHPLEVYVPVAWKR